MGLSVQRRILRRECKASKLGTRFQSISPTGKLTRKPRFHLQAQRRPERSMLEAPTHRHQDHGSQAQSHSSVFKASIYLDAKRAWDGEGGQGSQTCCDIINNITSTRQQPFVETSLESTAYNNKFGVAELTTSFQHHQAFSSSKSQKVNKTSYLI